VSILFHSIIHVGPNSSRGSRAPVRKHWVGRDIDVDLTALQPMLLIESTIVLWGSVPIASLHEGIPQQQRKAVTVQAPHAQTAVLKGAVRVVSHLRQKLKKLEFSKKNNATR
jgi:hypothetical protein